MDSQRLDPAGAGGRAPEGDARRPRDLQESSKKNGKRSTIDLMTMPTAPQQAFTWSASRSTAESYQAIGPSHGCVRMRFDFEARLFTRPAGLS